MAEPSRVALYGLRALQRSASDLKTKVFKTSGKYGLVTASSQAHPARMSEVVFAGNVTYYPHARLTPIGGLWEGAVEIVTFTEPTIYVCTGVHDDADSAFEEAVTATVELVRLRG